MFPFHFIYLPIVYLPTYTYLCIYTYIAPPPRPRPPLPLGHAPLTAPVLFIFFLRHSPSARCGRRRLRETVGEGKAGCNLYSPTNDFRPLRIGFPCVRSPWELPALRTRREGRPRPGPSPPANRLFHSRRTFSCRPTISRPLGTARTTCRAIDLKAIMFVRMFKTSL